MKDLTQGNPFGVILKFALPMFFSMIFQQVYSIVDSVVAGRYIGVDALGAVGVSQPITTIFIAIAVGAGMGINVVISSFFGAHKYKRVKSAISTALITLLIMSGILTILGLIGCRGMLSLLGTPADIFQDAELYLRIYIAGISFLLLYNGANAIFTALGDSLTPLIFLICSSLFNIFLDIFFVKTFHMGVDGVAWATFVAQGLASVLAVVTVFFKTKKIKVKSYRLFNLLLLKKMSIVAIPSILQQSFVSVGQLFIQGKINSFGSIVVAGYAATNKVHMCVVSVLNTVGNALSSYVAQNAGAGKIDRIKTGIKEGLKISMTMGILMSIGMLLLRNDLMGIFVEGTTAKALQTIDVGVGFLKIVAPFYVVVCIKFIFDGYLRGVMEMKGFMSSTFADLILRVILSYSLSIPLGYIGIWLAWPVGWILGASVSVWFGMRRLGKVVHR